MRRCAMRPSGGLAADRRWHPRAARSSSATDGGRERPGRRRRGLDAGAGIERVRAQLGDPSLTDPTRAVQAAGKARCRSAAAARVGDGRRRRHRARHGPDRGRASRRDGGVGAAGASRSPRHGPRCARFAERPDGGRADCLARAGRRAGGAALALDAGTGRPCAAGDLPHPDARRRRRRAGRGRARCSRASRGRGVSRRPMVRVVGGHAEIRARTRSAPGAGGGALSRDAGAMISLSDVQAAGGSSGCAPALRARRPPRPGARHDQTPPHRVCASLRAGRRRCCWRGRVAAAARTR